MSDNVKLQPKPIAMSVKRAAHGDMEIDRSGDEQLLMDENYSWDDLNVLKEELGSSIMSFVLQVKSTLEQPEIINNLGSRSNEFNQTVNLFFSDVDEFSHKVKTNREMHEGRTGHVKDLTEFNLYNQVAMTYHSLFAELGSLITPTISKLMMIISEIVDLNNTLTEEDIKGKTNE